jgi:hypothetical protein
MSALFQTLPMIAAGLIAVIAYGLLSSLNLSFSTSSASGRMASFAEGRKSVPERVGEGVMSRLGLDLSSWGINLRWAQLSGAYLGANSAAILGLSILYAGAAGILLFALFGLSPFVFLAMGAAFFMPSMQLGGAAEKARTEARRGLPEAAAFVAGEMAAGMSVEESLGRAGRLPGVIGNIIREAKAEADSSHQLLLAHAGSPGTFRAFCNDLGVTQLSAFAAQIDMVALRGSDAPRQMSSVAKGLARDYRGEVSRNASNLDNQLLIPTTIYFFLPMLATLLVPLFMGVMGLFGGAA